MLRFFYQKNNLNLNESKIVIYYTKVLNTTMDKIRRIIFLKVFPKYDIYVTRIARNKLKRLIINEVENKYLFILSAPSSGSTLLNELISTSSSVSVNNPFGTREGQTLPTIRKVMFDHKRRWDVALDFDWEIIKKEWRKYWDTTKSVLLEKSPPNIIRTTSINKVFPNSHFIILYRNPYAQCESLIRRYKQTPKSAAEFALRSLEYQRKNQLLPNSISISYEDLTNTPEESKRRISEFLPELLDIKTAIRFSAHNFKNEKLHIQNLNNHKIAQLNQKQLDEMNFVFSRNTQLLNYFNYELITHAVK
ncbi:MAG: hypothetical protein ACI94Y_001094 [Maribacter sp.]